MKIEEKIKELGIPKSHQSGLDWRAFLDEALYDENMDYGERLTLGQFLLENRESFGGIIQPETVIRWLMVTAPKPEIPEITPEEIRSIAEGGTRQDKYMTRREYGVIPPAKKKRKYRPWD